MSSLSRYEILMILDALEEQSREIQKLCGHLEMMADLAEQCLDPDGSGSGVRELKENLWGICRNVPAESNEFQRLRLSMIGTAGSVPPGR